MSTLPEAVARTDLRRIQQVVKWVVYSLLLLNFAYYVYEDWSRAAHTLTADAGLADWTQEFATSIDLVGWFLLLFMYELETYALEDESWTGRVAHTVRGVRVVCFLMLAHTVFAYANSLVELRQARPVAEATSLCALADRDVSYVYNLHYTAIDPGNCAALSDDGDEFYWLGEEPVVTSEDGLRLERQLARVDLAEAVIWLLIVLSIEIVVRLQDRGVSGGAVISVANAVKVVLYLALGGIAIYWASLSHWLYAWDEFLWIAGFAVIEMNVNEWRDELLGGESAS